MADNNFSESLFQAIDIITSKRLSALEFDKTIVAEIIDNSEAEFGDYVCSDGSTTFHAYTSDTTYKAGTQVYVTVPNGDFNKQKQITGKYITEQSERYNYISPFDNFVDMTGNLAIGAPEVGLIANGATETKLVGKKITSMPAGKDFTRLGIKADFKSWLKTYNTIDGNYGLRVTITSSEPTTTTTAPLGHTYTFFLDCKDMIGNPYNYEAYSSQEIVLNLSHVKGKMQTLAVHFYQNKNFINTQGQLIQTSSPNNYISENNLYNLFVNNVNVSLGYDVSDFDEDTVILYTLDAPTYNNTSEPSTNLKQLSVRWVRVTDDGIYSIDNANEIPPNTIIRWYKYELKTQEATDSLAGPFWTEIANTHNSLSITVDPDTSEMQQLYKVVIESPSMQYLTELLQDAIDDDERDFILGQHRVYESNILTLSSEVPVVDKMTANLVRGLKIACDTAGYNGVYLLYDETNEIQNVNEANKARIMTAQWNSVTTGDPTLDEAEHIIWRIPLFNTMIDAPREGREYSLKDSSTLVWYEYVKTDGTTATTSKNDALPSDGLRFTAIYIKRAPGAKVSGDSDAIGSQTAWTANQEFRIKSYYTESATNNIVKCYVQRDSVAYEGAFEMTFGPKGSNGTDFTFRMEFDDTIPALTGGNTDLVKVNLTMHDYNNDEVPLFYENGIELSWYATDNKVKVYTRPGAPISLPATIRQPYFYIQLSSANVVPQYNIIQAMVKSDPTANGGEVDKKNITLKTYFPIPYRSATDTSGAAVTYTGIEGATKILYGSDGTNPKYYKETYRLWKNNSSEETGMFWYVAYIDDNKNPVEIKNVPTSDASTNKFYPKIVKNVIVVPSMYLDGLNTKICVIGQKGGKVLWTQPILMIKDLYSSAYLNAWDGGLTIDENNGIILSTMMGAGIKESDNTFSGVMMGDVNDVMDSNMKIGLYGYNHGEQAFGWKVDGTGFIGKKGKGQIVFNGNQGTINSGVWSASNGELGMLIDLDGTDGTSSLLKARGDGGSVELDTSTDAPYLFKVADGSDKALIFIQTNNHADSEGTFAAGESENEAVTSQYYLQSSQYKAGVDGTRLDLQNGKFTSYGSCGRAEIATNQATFFRLADADNKTLFVIKTSGDNGNSGNNVTVGLNENTVNNSQYYLQSSQYQAGKKGTRLDLQNGKFTSYGESGRMEIATNDSGGAFFRLADSNNNILFIVKNSTGDDDGSDDRVSSQYYLQSATFSSSNRTGMRVDLQNGKLTSYGPNGRFELDTGAANKSTAFFRLADKNNKTLFVLRNGSDANDSDGATNSISSEYYLQSYNFSSGTLGTRLDLQNGKFVSYGGNGRFEISTGNTNTYFFALTDKDKKPLFVIKNDTGDDDGSDDKVSSQYYLQSVNFSAGTTKAGSRLDLQNGKFLSYGQNGRVEISTDSAATAFFRLADKNNKTLFIIKNSSADSDGDNEGGNEAASSLYYLQSSNFDTANKIGTRLDLQTGKYTSYGKAGRITMDTRDKIAFHIQGYDTTEQKFKSMMMISTDETIGYYLQSLDFKEHAQDVEGTGFKLDLKNGKLIANTFELFAKNGNGFLKLGTLDKTYAINVNDKFQVDWDGNVFLRSDSPGDFTAGGVLTVESGLIISKGKGTVNTNLPIYEFNSSGGRIGPWYITEQYIYCEATAGQNSNSLTFNGKTINAVAKLGTDGTMWMNSQAVRLLLSDNHFMLQHHAPNGPLLTFNSDSIIFENAQGSGLQLLAKYAKDPRTNVLINDSDEPLCILKINDANYLRMGDKNGIALETASTYMYLRTSTENLIGLDGPMTTNSLYDALAPGGYGGYSEYKNVLIMGKTGVSISRYPSSRAEAPIDQQNRGLFISDTSCGFQWTPAASTMSLEGQYPGGGGAWLRFRTQSNLFELTSQAHFMDFQCRTYSITAKGPSSNITLDGPKLTLSISKLQINGDEGYDGDIIIKALTDVYINNNSTSWNGTHSHSWGGTASVGKGGGTVNIGGSTGDSGYHQHTVTLNKTLIAYKLVFKKGICVDFSSGPSSL